jgi:hypothetical protein
MGRHSEYYEVAVAVFAAVLALLLQPLSEQVFGNALLALLEPYMPSHAAQVVARLWEVVLSLGGAILLILYLYRFLRREVEREVRNEDAWLRRELAGLRADGIGLRVRGQSLGEGAPEWIAECARWSAKVMQTLAKLSPSDAESFKAPAMVPPPRIPLKGSDDPEQVRAYCEHDFHLVQLEKLFEKYDFQDQNGQRRHHAGVAHAS